MMRREMADMPPASCDTGVLLITRLNSVAEGTSSKTLPPIPLSRKETWAKQLISQGVGFINPDVQGPVYFKQVMIT